MGAAGFHDCSRMTTSTSGNENSKSFFLTDREGVISVQEILHWEHWERWQREECDYGNPGISMLTSDFVPHFPLLRVTLMFKKLKDVHLK